MRDIYEGIDEDDLDRVVLDLPEPWRVVKHASSALRPGGSCSRTCRRSCQVARLREELEASAFGMAQTLEVLHRTWHVEGQSVRPDHRMVAHTGFLTTARLLGRAGLDESCSTSDLDRTDRAASVDLDEDALAGALFGGLDDRLFLPGGHVRRGPRRHPAR